MDVRWPQLCIVYTILLRLVLSEDAELSTKRAYFDCEFLTKLVQLFESQDQRERDYLKTITHRIYILPFGPQRKHIRKQIYFNFYTASSETGAHSGISELLEIFGSVVSGLNAPVKAEYREALKNALMPLHKVGQRHRMLSTPSPQQQPPLRNNSLVFPSVHPTSRPLWVPHFFSSLCLVFLRAPNFSLYL
jgi:serine/threonine-protein phosphatase 2A regulatory subunit B'